MFIKNVPYLYQKSDNWALKMVLLSRFGADFQIATLEDEFRHKYVKLEC